MRRSIPEWIRQQLSTDVLASDASRMAAAIVVASLTHLILWFVLADLTSLVSRESLQQPIPLLATYFLFCVFYFIFCQRAFNSLDAESLQASLKMTKPKSESPIASFLLGESGTSHATMFSFLALAGVGALAVNIDSDENSTRILLLQIFGLFAVVGSWISNVASFALQYARDDANAGESEFRFPDGIPPQWSDYLYTAIMVSATLSTADVDVMTRPRRRMVSIHTIIAFAFNTVIVAMLVATIL